MQETQPGTAGTTAGSPEAQTPGRDGKSGVGSWLERAEIAVYVAVALAFLLVAAAVLGYSIYILPHNIGEHGFLGAIITLITDLLLVVIVLELMRTPVGYIELHVLSIYPFLVIASISATRRILTLGAEMAIEEGIPKEEFNQALVDLGVNAFIVLVIAAALYLTSRSEPQQQH